MVRYTHVFAPYDHGRSRHQFSLTDLSSLAPAFVTAGGDPLVARPLSILFIVTPPYRDIIYRFVPVVTSPGAKYAITTHLIAIMWIIVR
jgi:hypothetical protein